MGTRADFYVQKPEGLEWLGSIAWDGYEIGHVALASTEHGFRQSLEEFFATRDDVTRPERGWPWPWNTSDTTDYGYVLVEGRGVFYKEHNGNIVSAADDGDEEGEKTPVSDINFDYPDMSAVKNVALGPRSGVIVVSA